MEIAERIVIAIVVIVIGLALFPTVSSSALTASNATLNSTQKALLAIVPVIYVAGILLISVAMFLPNRSAM